MVARRLEKNMPSKRSWILASALALAATSGRSAPVASPLTPRNISVEAKEAGPELRASVPIFIDMVGEAFAAKGFTTIEAPGRAGLVADLILSRDRVGTGTAKVARAGSGAAGGAGSAVGIGMNVILPTAKTRVVPLQLTRLEVRIHNRDEPGILWQGAAITVRPAGTPKGQDAAVASDLIAALLREYPATPESVISVP
jgi:hypothetical protein